MSISWGGLRRSLGYIQACLKVSLNVRTDNKTYRCLVELNPSNYAIPDAWSLIRARHSLEQFREAVLRRQDYRCAICGTTLREVLEVAHISSYATDITNRANPANGIALVCILSPSI